MKKYFAAAAVLLAAIMIFACSCGKDDARDAAAGLSASDADEGIVSESDAVQVSRTDANWYEALDDDGRALADVVLNSAGAFNDEDLRGYMTTVDPEGEAYDETREYVRLIFNKYDLTAEITGVEVIELKAGTATVRVSQTTVRNGTGGGFADCETVLIHTMVRRNGNWYISATEVESRRELDSSWDGLAGFVNDGVSAETLLSGSDAYKQA